MIPDPPDILKKIIRHKALEVGERANQVSLMEMSARAERGPAVRPFAEDIKSRIAAGQPAVIAEIKKASPSKGLLREHFDPSTIVCTDRYCVFPRMRRSPPGRTGSVHFAGDQKGLHD